LLVLRWNPYAGLSQRTFQHIRRNYVAFLSEDSDAARFLAVAKDPQMLIFIEPPFIGLHVFPTILKQHIDEILNQHGDVN